MTTKSLLFELLTHKSQPYGHSGSSFVTKLSLKREKGSELNGAKLRPVWDDFGKKGSGINC